MWIYKSNKSRPIITMNKLKKDTKEINEINIDESIDIYIDPMYPDEIVLEQFLLKDNYPNQLYIQNFLR